MFGVGLHDLSLKLGKGKLTRHVCFDIEGKSHDEDATEVESATA